MATRTITLTDHPPVKIDEDRWPVIAQADDHDGKIEAESMTSWSLRVRQEQDDSGRYIVYGVYRTVLPDDRDRRAGQIVNTTGELVAAIRAVGAALNLTAERERALVQECIADLPPVTLEP